MSEMLERAARSLANMDVSRRGFGNAASEAAYAEFGAIYRTDARGALQAALDDEDAALVDHVARAIYAVELARDNNCNSLMIRIRGYASTIDDEYRIEAYEENPEAWREYARAAIRSMRFAQIPVDPEQDDAAGDAGLGG